MTTPDADRGRVPTWAWWVAGLTPVGVVAALLAWSAISSGDDPRLFEGNPQGSGAKPSAVTEATPADGLDFAEVERRVGDECLCLLVADTPEERASGLRFRESELDRVDGMLFVHDEPQPQPGFFTMAGVVEPLDVAFYGADGDRMASHAMTPCDGAITDCPRYEAPAGWQFALETVPGELPAGDLGGPCDRS